LDLTYSSIALVIDRFFGEPNSGIPNSSYCPDMKGVGNDFDIDPDPEHGFEIFNW
jgi:hypothetical protein